VKRGLIFGANVDLPVLRDGLGRVIHYLRLSITERCNLHCRYCRPPPGREMRSTPAEFLSESEIIHLARLMVELGVRRIRLTGGEPLLFANLPGLIQSLTALPHLEEVTMSTNAVYLARWASDLQRAGLRRVNISLDTLDPQLFRFITRGGDVTRVLSGIDAALTAGLGPVKLNMVVMGGINDQEIPALVDFARQRGLLLRLIEAMPMGEGQLGSLITAAEMTDLLQRHFHAELSALAQDSGLGPARYHRVTGLGVDIGIISAQSQHFCATCNRVRLTARGQLVLCLGEHGGVDLRTPLRSGVSDLELRCLIQEAILRKPSGHNFSRGASPHRMAHLGG